MTGPFICTNLALLILAGLLFVALRDLSIIEDEVEDLKGESKGNKLAIGYMLRKVDAPTVVTLSKEEAQEAIQAVEDLAKAEEK